MSDEVSSRTVAAHPHGVDERESGEFLPGLAEVQLVGELGRGGRIGLDLVADEQERIGRLSHCADDDVLARIKVEHADLRAEPLVHDDPQQRDRGVAVGVGADRADLLQREAREDAHRHGRAVAADHPDGQEADLAAVFRGIDDRGKRDIDLAREQHADEPRGHGGDELGIAPRGEPLDEREGVEVLHAADADRVHGERYARGFTGDDSKVH
jgi:hypothetical protein